MYAFDVDVVGVDDLADLFLFGEVGDVGEDLEVFSFEGRAVALHPWLDQSDIIIAAITIKGGSGGLHTFRHEAGEEENSEAGDSEEEGRLQVESDGGGVGVPAGTGVGLNL